LSGSDLSPKEGGEDPEKGKVTEQSGRVSGMVEPGSIFEIRGVNRSPQRTTGPLRTHPLRHTERGRVAVVLTGMGSWNDGRVVVLAGKSEKTAKDKVYTGQTVCSCLYGTCT